MKNHSYRKIYPYEMSVFIEKFEKNTISQNPLKKMKQAYRYRANNRVFVGDYNLKYDQFEVYTYPDLCQSFLNPYLFMRRMFLLIAPSCIYGRVKEDHGQTIVDYVIDKKESVKVTAVFGFSICCMVALWGIGYMVFNGISFVTLLSIVLPVPWFIIINQTMNVPEIELDALVKFMEDLAN